MVDNCRHVGRVRSVLELGAILSPERWNCAICSTTESVWACLSCGNVACGRYNEEHALRHHRETQHPLAVEINDKFVFCYECDDYILNDNAAGDIRLVRMALDAVAAQQFDELEREMGSHAGGARGSGRLRNQLRTNADPRARARRLLQADLVYTAVLKHRVGVLSWALRTWQTALVARRSTVVSPLTSITSLDVPTKSRQPQPKPPPSQRQPFRPGTMGLRNLGNTCYMNSVLQVFCHLPDFADYMSQHVPEEVQAAIQHIDEHSTSSSSRQQKDQTQKRVAAFSTAKKQQQLKLRCQNERRRLRSDSFNSRPPFLRQSTTECLDAVENVEDRAATAASSATTEEDSDTSDSWMSGGSDELGAAEQVTYNAQRRIVVDSSSNREVSPLNALSLLMTLHALLRVMWSGLRAVVSPVGMLSAVWFAVPSMHGHKQHDAQELLMQLLDRLMMEITGSWDGLKHPNFVTRIFLVTQVSIVECRQCGHRSSENHSQSLGVSLAFPDRFVSNEEPDSVPSLEDLMRYYKADTELEFYYCEKCSADQQLALRRPSNSSSATSSAFPKSTCYKRTHFQTLPRVLWLHLMRFRWTNQHGGKLNTHVTFPLTLCPAEFGWPEIDSSHQPVYELTALIEHHGRRGLSGGHYTAYVFHRQEATWFHCNDAIVRAVQLDEVLRSRAYILFYQRTNEADSRRASSVCAVKPKTESTANRRRAVSASLRAAGNENSTLTKQRRR